MTRKIIRGSTNQENFVDVFQIKPFRTYARRSKNNASVAILTAAPGGKEFFWHGITALGNTRSDNGDFFETLWCVLIQDDLELYEFETKGELRDWLKVWL